MPEESKFKKFVNKVKSSFSSKKKESTRPALTGLKAYERHNDTIDPQSIPVFKPSFDYSKKKNINELEDLQLTAKRKSEIEHKQHEIHTLSLDNKIKKLRSQNVNEDFSLKPKNQRTVNARSYGDGEPSTKPHSYYSDDPKNPHNASATKEIQKKSENKPVSDHRPLSKTVVKKIKANIRKQGKETCKDC